MTSKRVMWLYDAPSRGLVVHRKKTGMSMDPIFSFKVGFRYHPGPDSNRLWLRAASTPWDPLTLGAMVLIRGLDGEGFDFGVAAVAEDDQDHHTKSPSSALRCCPGRHPTLAADTEPSWGSIYQRGGDTYGRSIQQF